MDVELTGMRELGEKIRQVRAVVTRPAMERGLRAAGRVVRQAMEERAPVRIDPRTPNSTSLEPGAVRAGIRAVLKRDDTPLAIEIGPTGKVAHVCRFIEYGFAHVSGGTSRLAADGRRRGKGQVTSYVAARPFLRPAFMTSLAGAEAALVESVRKSIKEQVG